MSAAPQSASLSTSNQDAVIHAVLQDAGIVETVTKGGWCLGEGLSHVISVNERSLEAIVQQSGAPQVYDSISSNKCRHEKSGTDAAADMNDPKSCFESLCRIIAGQQLAGAAAQAVWGRLLETTKPLLTPRAVLELAEK
jgi:hypothetical protein